LLIRAKDESDWTAWTITTVLEGPLVAHRVDGYKHDRNRWDRDGVLTVPAAMANGTGEFGAGHTLQEFVLCEE
jgi:hypothetical protein